MGTFEIIRTVRASPERTFSVIGDLAAYGEFLPMTSIEADAGTIAPGWHFTARTGKAPFRLVDRMQVSEWDPPHGFRVLKLGPVLDGWAQVHLTGEGADTRVVWRERIVVRPVGIGGPLSRLYDPVNTWLFGRALDRMTLKARGE